MARARPEAVVAQLTEEESAKGVELYNRFDSDAEGVGELQDRYPR